MPARKMLTRSSLAFFCPFKGKSRDVRNQSRILRIYLHITGRATWNHAVKYKQHPLARLENYFTARGNPFAHYAIDPWGRIAQFAEESERPWAQGWGAYGGRSGLESKLKSGELVVPEWWYASMADRSRPWKLASPSLFNQVARGKTPNDDSVAIEMIQYGNQFKLTTTQYFAAYVLCLDICTRHLLPFGPMTIRGHEDADPWGRGNRYGGWDPGAGRVNGKPRWCWEAFFNIATGMPCEHAQHRVERRNLCRAVRATPERPKWLERIERRVFA